MNMKYAFIAKIDGNKGKVENIFDTLEMALEVFDSVLKKRKQSEVNGDFSCSVHAIEADVLNDIDTTNGLDIISYGSMRAHAIDTQSWEEKKGYMVADNGNGFVVLATDKENAASVLREVSNNYYAVDTSEQRYWV